MKAIKPIPEFDAEDPLKPVPNESVRASKALRDYALMGSARSLHRLEQRYILMEEEWKKNPSRNLERPPTTRWMTISNYSVKFRWQDRVKAYDEIVRLEEQKRYMEDRLRWREHRLKAAKGLLTKAVGALQNHEGPSTLSQISRALETAMKELRIEFGEEEQVAATSDVVIRVVREDKKPEAQSDD